MSAAERLIVPYLPQEIGGSVTIPKGKTFLLSSAATFQKLVHAHPRDNDVEKKIPDGDGEIIRNKKRNLPCRIAYVFVVFSLMIIVCVAIPLYYRADTRYSVAIDSVSGLDTRAGLSFNLTLGVASASYGSMACINPGTYVVAFYRGIRVAASDALWRQTCAMPRNVVERPVVARATALPVGQVLDSLAAEMRDGVAAFDFVLHVPPRSYGAEGAMSWWVTDCKGSPIGDAAVLCDYPNPWL